MPKQLSHHVVIGFDFGMRHIGVAVGQTITQTAKPLTTLKAQDGIPRWSEIAKLINDWKADTLVVGLPLNMDGTMQPIAYSARKFARRLGNRFQLPVYLVDERLTSYEAKRLLKKSIKHFDPQQIDRYAAKLILESWLKNL